MSNLIRGFFFHHRGLLIASAVLFCIFQLLTCAIISSIDIPRAFDQILLFAPPAIRTLMEQSMLGGSSAGILAFTWNHPVTHALVIAIAIALGARAVAGEIENGAIELVLAQPLSRFDYLAAHVVFAIVSMAVVAFVGLLGTVAGQNIFHLPPFGWDRLLRLLANVLLLQMSFYSLTLLFSSFGRESGRVAILSVLVAIVSLLVNVVATLWNKAAFMKPYSLHTYYEPRAILVDGNLALSSIVVLGIFIVAATGGAFARFLTRDVP